MPDSHARLSILFEPPFWIALYEREAGGNYEVCKITFGAEPKDPEVYDFFLRNFNRLVFSPPLEAGKTAESKTNPKRMQRQIKRATEERSIGTKAQQALRLQQELNKTDRKTHAREEKELEAQRRFALKQQKRREKHRGR